MAWLSNAKVVPSKEDEPPDLRAEERGPLSEDKVEEEEYEMEVIRLHTLFKMYGGQRHPKIGSYEEFEKRGDLIKWDAVPPQATTIYISHEWVGSNHPDPDGTQMYHLLLLLERLQRGEVARTDMDPFHSLVFKQNTTTTSDEWKQVLSAEKTYV